MGLLGGLKKVAGGVVKTVTAPVTTAAKVVGTGLETGGKVLNEVAEGDLKGAADAAASGVKKQVGNVGGYFNQKFDAVKDVAGGTADFLKGGAELIGTPIKGAARIAAAPLQTGVQILGTGLETGGKVLGEVAEGDLNGAAGAVVNGWQQQGNNLGNFVQRNVQGAKEIFGGPASVLAAGATAVGGAAVGLAQGAYNTGSQAVHTVADGAQSFVNYQVNNFKQGAEFIGNGAQTGLRTVGTGLEHAGVGLQEAAR